MAVSQCPSFTGQGSLDRKQRMRRLATPKLQIRCNVRFSNRPFGVKRFQTIHLCGVDVTRGLVLLSGIGAWALPSWDPRTRRDNLLGDLAVSVTSGPSGSANTSSTVPRG